jgi:hypothetical protein
MGNRYLLESWEVTFKYDGKRGKGARRRGKGGKKGKQYAFIKSIQV